MIFYGLVPHGNRSETGLPFRTLIAFLVFTFAFSNSSFAQPDFSWAFSVAYAHDFNLYDNIGAMATDDQDNMIVIGNFGGSTDFDPSSGSAVITTPFPNQASAFIAKYDSSANYVWAFQLEVTTVAGGPVIYQVDTDPWGNVYIAGNFTNTVDFDPSPNQFLLTSDPTTFAGLPDAFLAKYDPNGNLIWAKRVGGASHDYGYDMAVDHHGNAFLIGVFNDTADFDPAGTSFTLAAVNGDNNYVAKFDSTGNFQWAFPLGISHPTGVDVDGSGNVFVCGFFNVPVDFDPSPTSAVVKTPTSNYESYVAKYDSSGNFQWVHQIGDGGVWAFDIKVDDIGNSYVTGEFGGFLRLDTTSNTLIESTAFIQDAFLAKYDPQGQHLWGGAIFSVTLTEAHAIALDDSGGVYLTGGFRDTADFDFSSNVVQLTDSGLFQTVAHVFVTKYATSNGSFQWAFPVVTPQNYSFGGMLEVDTKGNLLMGCDYGGNSDFDPSPSYALVNTNGDIGRLAWAKYGPTALCPESQVNLSICAGDSVWLDGAWRSSPGTYLESYTTGISCDSSVIYQLQVNAISTDSIAVSICPDDSILINGNWQSAQGVYIDTLTAITSCDSIVVTTLNHLPTGYTTQSTSICLGDSVLFGNQYLGQAGTYYDTLAALNTCDSIVELNLTVETVDTSVTQNDSLLTAQATGASLQWWDCDLQVLVPNAQSSSFVPDSSGNFAVIVNQNGCVDTSACFAVHITPDTTTSIVEAIGGEHSFQLFPNPADNEVWLKGSFEGEARIRLLDQQGRVALNKLARFDQGIIQLDLSAIPNGIYVLSISNIRDSSPVYLKLVKAR